MHNYKFSDFINPSGQNLNGFFQIEDEWFLQVIEVLSHAGIPYLFVDKLTYLREVIKELDDKLEITSLNQIAFLSYLISESKQFEQQFSYQSNEKVKAFVDIVADTVKQHFEK